MKRNKRFILGMAIMSALGMANGVAYAAAKATPAVPLSWTPGTAVVDGNISEWNLSTDAATRMCEAGSINADGTCNGKEQLSTLYARYNCNTNTMYVLVLKQPGHTTDESASWVKIYDLSQSPQVQGPANASNFHDVTVGGVVQGYEASFTLAAGTYNSAEIHLEVDGSRTSSTGKIDYTRSITVPENCTMPTIPTSGTVGGYNGFNNWGQCQSTMSGGTTLSVVGRLLPASGVNYNDGSVTGEVYNNSNTPQTVTLVSYKEFYPDTNFDDQTVNGALVPGQRVNDYQTVTVPANGHVNLTAQLPGCSTQIDLVCADVIQYLGGGNLYGARKLAYYHAHQPNNGWCNSTGVTSWNGAFEAAAQAAADKAAADAAAKAAADAAAKAAADKAAADAAAKAAADAAAKAAADKAAADAAAKAAADKAAADAAAKAAADAAAQAAADKAAADAATKAAADAAAKAAADKAAADAAAQAAADKAAKDAADKAAKDAADKAAKDAADAKAAKDAADAEAKKQADEAAAAKAAKDAADAEAKKQADEAAAAKAAKDAADAEAKKQADEAAAAQAAKDAADAEAKKQADEAAAAKAAKDAADAEAKKQADEAAAAQAVKDAVDAEAKKQADEAAAAAKAASDAADANAKKQADEAAAAAKAAKDAQDAADAAAKAAEEANAADKKQADEAAAKAKADNEAKAAEAKKQADEAAAATKTAEEAQVGENAADKTAKQVADNVKGGNVNSANDSANGKGHDPITICHNRAHNPVIITIDDDGIGGSFNDKLAGHGLTETDTVPVNPSPVPGGGHEGDFVITDQASRDLCVAIEDVEETCTERDNQSITVADEDASSSEMVDPKGNGNSANDSANGKGHQPVAVCHNVPHNPHVIVIDDSALQAHLKHLGGTDFVVATDADREKCGDGRVYSCGTPSPWAPSFKGGFYNADTSVCSYLPKALQDKNGNNMKGWTMPQWIPVTAWLETDNAKGDKTGGLKVKVSSLENVKFCPAGAMATGSCTPEEASNEQEFTTDANGRVDFVVLAWWPGVPNNALANGKVENLYKIAVKGGETGEAVLHGSLSKDLLWTSAMMNNGCTLTFSGAGSGKHTREGQE